MSGGAALLVFIVYCLGCQGLVWLLTMDGAAAGSTDATGGVVAGGFVALGAVAAASKVGDQIKKRLPDARAGVLGLDLALGAMGLCLGGFVVLTLRQPAATFRGPLAALWGDSSRPPTASYERTYTKQGRVVRVETVTGAHLNAETRAATLGFYVAAGALPLGCAAIALMAAANRARAAGAER